MPSNQRSPSPHSLREVRCNFVQHKLEALSALDILQYGTVTLIDKKLDSWIDGKPELASYTWTEDHQMLKLDHDHLQCRKERLAKQRSKLQRSWSGNISMIQRDSLIDVLPKTTSDVTGQHNKRTKPRRISSDDHIVLRSDVKSMDAMEADGDIQTVRKVVLERKLANRPLLPQPQTEYREEGLFRELRSLQQTPLKPRFTVNKNALTSKQAPQRIVYRVHSLNGPRQQPVSFVPQSA